MENDSRVTRIVPEQLYAQGIAQTASQILSLTSQSLWGVGYSYVCAALQRGWLANASNGGQPLAAWQYITQVFQAFLSGAAPQSQKMPYWMWAVGRAISAKAVPTRCGNIYYKATQGAQVPSTALYSLGPVAYSYSGNLYDRGVGDTDMFPNAAIPPSANQEQAFSDLCGFMTKAIPGRASDMCDSTVKTIFDNDVSAFCSAILSTGYGDQNVGGFNYIASLEVPILTPALSTLLTQSSAGPTGVPTRASKRTTVYAGDQLFTSNMLSAGLPISKWKNKLQPNFKAVDFREFHDVVCIWATKLVSQYFQDPANQSAATAGLAQDAAGAQCPLTVQEIGLLLRNEFMTVFGNTQTGVQSLLPILPQTGNDNQFMPYLTGTTGCGLQTFKVKLPTPLVENARSLLLHAVPHKRDVQLLYPIIGQYVNDELVRSDYNFEYQDGDRVIQTYPTFAAVPLLARKAISKKTGKEEWVSASVETVIDFVDTNNGSQFVFINDPTRLSSLAALWNNWVTKYEAYSSPITVLSPDPGVNVLCSVNQTLYWLPQTISSQAMAEEVRDERVQRDKSLSSTVYAGREAVAISFRERPFGVTQAITSRWILPVYLINDGGVGSQNSSPYIKIQNIYDETNSTILSTTGSGGTTIATRHSIFADSMVHARDGKAQMDTDFETLAAQGHAGILSSLAATFLGHAFGSGVGDVASAVASALPI